MSIHFARSTGRFGFAIDFAWLVCMECEVVIELTLGAISARLVAARCNSKLAYKMAMAGARSGLAATDPLICRHVAAVLHFLHKSSLQPRWINLHGVLQVGPSP